MAESVFKDVGIWVEDARMGLYATQFTLNHDRAAHDVTGFEHLAHEYHKGLGDGSFSVTAFDDVVLNEKALTLNLDTGTATRVAILEAGAQGSYAFMAAGVLNAIEKSGQVDNVAGVTLGGPATRALASGSVFYSTGLATSDGPATASVTGSTITLGALGAGQELWCLQIMSNSPATSGTSPTWDGLLLSATTDWATPTTHITFAQATDTANLVQFSTVDGDTTPETDTFWRYESTIGGSATPTFSPIVIAGIRTKPAVT